VTIKYSSSNIKTKLRNNKVGFHNKHLTTKKDYQKGGKKWWEIKRSERYSDGHTEDAKG